MVEEFVVGLTKINKEDMLHQLVDLVHHLKYHNQQEKPAHVSPIYHLDMNRSDYLDLGCLSWKQIVMVARERLNTSMTRMNQSSHGGMKRLMFFG